MKIERALSQKTSRRAFLAAAATTAVGLAIACKETTKEPQGRPETKFEPTPVKEVKQFKFLWQENLHRQRYSWSGYLPPFLAVNGDVYLTNASEKFTKLNLENGTSLWPQAWDNSATPLVESGGFVVVVRNDLDRFYGLYTENGRQKWVYRPEGYFNTISNITSLPIVFDNQVYFVEREGGFFKVGVANPKTGVEIKFSATNEQLSQYSQFPYNVHFESYGGIINITDSRIIIGEKGLMFGIDRQTGTIVWNLEINSLFLEGGFMVGDKMVYKTNKEKVLLLDIISGNLEEFSLEPDSSFSKLVVGNKVVISKYISPHSIFSTLDLTTREVSQLAEGSGILGSYGEIIYLISPGRDSVISANIITGETLENIEVQPRKFLASGDDKVLILDTRGDLVALNAKTLDKLWKFILEADVDTNTFVKLIGDLLIVTQNQFGGPRAGDQVYVVYFIDSKKGLEVNSRFSGFEEAVNLHLKDEYLFIEGEKTLTVFGPG